ncbi:hypothetical protein DICPUDRAFT_90873 [Dictyostelium purpureum]|uniref:SP-RING-type domain-containing protein n=1 Tax=Dictyostelium purpureum TaxID=5786 RepID=F1A5D7_DICPU|nr:uncharacterized protein DICPUDRAFT_90873 [Dictyostelium purpureum]EGC28591.1 hypothetical protein DICPUDRAFT_90873 [Dictyostelium purpureum]|eukprot:XP_003294880.1 hypothetical protein DICPUDRAFT_90873 [Dictyostelium purpureum]
MASHLLTESLPQLQDIERIISNTGKIKKITETLQYNLKQTALNLENHLNEDGDGNIKPLMDEIEKGFLTTIALNENLSKYSAGATNLKNYVQNEIRDLQSNSQSQETRNTVGSGENLADKYLSDYKLPLNIEHYRNHKDFKQLKREICDVNGKKNEDALGEDEDLIVASQTFNIHCPISTTILQDPYKSLVCNHIFSKAAIFSMFSRNSNSIRCPVAGCSKTIMKNQIQAAPEINDMVKRELRRRDKEIKAKRSQEEITEV